MVRIYGNTTEKTEDEEWTAVLGKIKESIDKSLVSVSVKSGTYLETEKLKAKVGNVQEEIHNLKQELRRRPGKPRRAAIAPAAEP